MSLANLSLGYTWKVPIYSRRPAASSIHDQQRTNERTIYRSMENESYHDGWNAHVHVYESARVCMCVLVCEVAQGMDVRDRRS